MTLTPAELSRGLLGALDASEGRRRRRARNTTADSIGLDIQRGLLDDIVRDDPAPDEFEAWLLARCEAEGAGDGAMRAMALSVWEQWQLAQRAPDVRAWIVAGARSDDRDSGAASCRLP
jgi:hypothetical protein